MPENSLPTGMTRSPTLLLPLLETIKNWNNNREVYKPSKLSYAQDVCSGLAMGPLHAKLHSLAERQWTALEYKGKTQTDVFQNLPRPVYMLITGKWTESVSMPLYKLEAGAVNKYSEFHLKPVFSFTTLTEIYSTARIGFSCIVPERFTKEITFTWYRSRL